MFKDLWEYQANVGQSRIKALKAELERIEADRNKLIDRMVETDNDRVIKRMDEKINEMEAKKAIIMEKPLKTAHPCAPSRKCSNTP